MLLDITITPSTIVILAAIFVCIALAVRRLLKRGLCDCNDKCDGCSAKCNEKCSSCSTAACSTASCSTASCAAVDSMVSRMEKTSMHIK